jgi:hypothetical protein
MGNRNMATDEYKYQYRLNLDWLPQGVFDTPTDMFEAMEVGADFVRHKDLLLPRIDAMIDEEKLKVYEPIIRELEEELEVGEEGDEEDIFL